MIEDFILSLEKYAKTINSKTMFILLKESEHCKIKAFKKIRYTLWYINKGEEKRFPIYMLLDTIRVTSKEEEKDSIRLFNLKFMEDMFNYISKPKFNLIVEGKYDGDELVPNPDN